MIWKILTLAACAIAVWGFIRRAVGDRGGSTPPVSGRGPRPQAEEFVKCPSCGAYTPRGQPCVCEVPPTP